MTEQQRRQIIEAARAACLKAARDAYDDAMMRGVCAEGALEAALGAIETLDPGDVVPDEQYLSSNPGEPES